MSQQIGLEVCKSGDQRTPQPDYYKNERYEFCLGFRVSAVGRLQELFRISHHAGRDCDFQCRNMICVRSKRLRTNQPGTHQPASNGDSNELRNRNDRDD